MLQPAVARLTGLATAPVATDLASWARAIGGPEGPLPLLGTGLRAAAYPALLWNGARLHHEEAPDDDGLLLVALAAAAPGTDAAEVERAVTAGLAASAALPAVVGDGPVIGRPTVGVVAAAACAAVAGGTDPSLLRPVLDVAAALMLVRPPDGGSPRVAGLAAGHCLAAGWLAPRVQGAGLTGMAGTLTHTVAAVTGRSAGTFSLGGVPPLDPTGSPAGDLLAQLA